MLTTSRAFSGFSVDDLAAAKKFYGETLGLGLSDVEGMGGGLVTLNLAGDNNVFVYEKPDHVPATFTVLNFPVPDIEAVVSGLSERGVSFERYDAFAADTDDSGIYRGGGPLIAWFTDPSGNVLSVIQQD